MSYEDQENHQIFDVRFKATNAQANDIWILLSCTKDWREYDQLDSQLRYGNWNLQPAPSQERVFITLRDITARHTQLRSELSQHVRRLAQEKGLEA